MSLHADLLRQAEHLANLFSKAEVLNLLQDTVDAVGAWQRVRDDDAARFFLMALPLWEQIRR